jgi:hypothetical protein
MSSDSVTILQPMFPNAGTVTVNPTFPVKAGQPSAPCTQEVHGACTISHCPKGVDGARLDAGTITVDSLAAGVHVVTAPDATGQYMQTENSNKSFRGGEQLTVTAAGGSRPGFSVDAQFALLLLLSSPAGVPTPGERMVTVMVSRSAPLQLTWSRGASNVLFLAQLFGARDDGDSFTSFSCAFDSMQGAGTIPPEVLGAFDPGSGITLLTAWQGQVPNTNTTIFVASQVATPDKAAGVALQLQ